MNYDKSEQTSEPKSEIEKDYATLFPISSPWLPRMNIKMSQPLQHAEAFILFCSWNLEHHHRKLVRC